MSEFRFSPRPNRADEIAWMSWGAAAFDRARAEDKPILLVDFGSLVSLVSRDG